MGFLSHFVANNLEFKGYLKNCNDDLKNQTHYKWYYDLTMINLSFTPFYGRLDPENPFLLVRAAATTQGENMAQSTISRVSIPGFVQPQENPIK